MKHVPLSPLAITEIERQRFWSKVDRSGGPEACWPWTACRLGDGYGLFQVWRKPRRNMIHANRLAYFLTHGVDPGPHLVCHTCDNPPCCNPAHLFLGAAVDNVADMVVKGRGARCHGERNGFAKLTTDQVLEMRALYAAGGFTQAALGRRFGVTGATAHVVLRNKVWRHLAGGQVEVRP